jgi:hypothetical protein
MADPSPADKLTCFLDQGRFCDADCMAYKVVPDGNQQLDGGQQHCVLLSALERTGRALQGIGGLMNALNTRWRKQSEDAQRGGPLAPPDPLGKR